MDGERTLATLIENGIIAETESEELVLTEELTTVRSDLRDDEAAREDVAWVTDQGLDPDELSSDIVANLRAIREMTDGMDPREMIAAANTLDRIEDPPRASGAPDGFIPLYAEDLNGFLSNYQSSVIYVWGEGSSACDTMREALSDLHEHDLLVEREVGLGAIYAPNNGEILSERYDVGVVPTTLFFVGQSVDARMLGARDLSSVLREVEIISEE